MFTTAFKTAIAAGLLIGAASAQAQTPAAPTGGSSSPEAASTPHQRETAGAMKPSDSMLRMAKQDGAVPSSFVKKAAIDGMTEVELGKVALSKSQDDKVRRFAQRMVTDHGKANMELATLAKSKGLEVPKSLDAEHQSMVQSLSAKSGEAFDAAYSEHMNADHAKAVALFEGASKGSDAELAAFASKTLPTLKEHKKMAEGLASSRTADASTRKSKHE